MTTAIASNVTSFADGFRTDFEDQGVGFIDTVKTVWEFVQDPSTDQFQEIWDGAMEIAQFVMEDPIEGAKLLADSSLSGAIEDIENGDVARGAGKIAAFAVTSIVGGVAAVKGASALTNLVQRMRTMTDGDGASGGGPTATTTPDGDGPPPTNSTPDAAETPSTPPDEGAPAPEDTSSTPPPSTPEASVPSDDLIRSIFGELDEAGMAFARRVDVKHVFQGDAEGGLHWVQQPGMVGDINVVERSKPSYQPGTTDIHLPDGTVKKSTMFPREWSQKDVLDAIRDAETAIGDAGFEPSVQGNGMEVGHAVVRGFEIRVVRDMETKQIVTALPTKPNKAFT